MSPQRKRILFCQAALVLTAAAHGLAGVESPAALSGLLLVLQALGGICIVLVVPGLLYLPLCRRLGLLRERSQAFYYLLLSVLITVACHALGHKLIHLLGRDAGFWELYASSCAFALVGWGLSARWGDEIQIQWPGRLVNINAAVGGVAVVLFALLSTPPGLVDESWYMSEQLYQWAPRLTYAPLPADVSIKPGPRWRRHGPRHQELDLTAGRAGVLQLTNRGTAPRTVQLKLLVKNGTGDDLMLRAWLGDQLLTGKQLLPYDRGDLEVSGLTGADSVRLPARFDHRREPRNTPTPVVLMSPALRLPPGQQTLRLELTPANGKPTPGSLQLIDLSDLDAHAFYGALTRHVQIGDTGDIQETLDLSRNFRWHWIQHSSSYDGGIFDGGGPTSVSDEPPGWHFVCYLALTFITDSITSIGLLWLVLLVLLLWVTLLLATEDNQHNRWWQLLPLLLAALIYTRLCRLGLESNAPDTLYLLVWLCVLKVFLDRRLHLGLLLAAVSFLIHVTTPQCLVMLAVAAWYSAHVRPLEGPWFVAKALAVLVLLMGLRVLIITPEAGLEGALFSGQNDFLASNRLSAVKAILTGDLNRIPDVLLKAGIFLPHAVAATCGALLLTPLTLLLPEHVRPRMAHHRGWTLFLFGLLYFLALSVVDVLRSHHLGPFIFPVLAGTARRLSQLRSEIHQRWPVVVALVVGLAALVFLLVATPDYTGTFSDWYMGLWTLRNP